MRRLVLTALVLSLAPACAQTVLVLPFFNLSGSSNLDWIGESIAEAVRETLAYEGILVLDRESREEAYHRLSLRPYAQLTRASVIKLGEVLDAERVVYGWFRLSPAPGASAPTEKSSLEVSARVMDLRRLAQQPEDQATAALEDLDKVQDRLAWQILGRLLEPAQAPPEGKVRGQRKPVRLDALESYIRGLRASSPEQKHRFFTQAARLDERFSQPCFQLGRLLWASQDYKVAAGWLERVTPDDLHYMEAAFLLGLCRYQLGEYDKAVASFESVAAALPLNEVWNNLGAAQSRLNRAEAALSFRKAIEGDPRDATYHFNLGYVQWKAGEFEAAADSFRAVLNLIPDDAEATLMLGRCLRRTPPQQTQNRIAGQERLKKEFAEMAYRQLRATLEGNRK